MSGRTDKSEKGSADFIAFARTALPEAIDEIEALRKRLIAAEAVCKNVEYAFGGGAPGHWAYPESKPEYIELTIAWEAWQHLRSL